MRSVLVLLVFGVFGCAQASTDDVEGTAKHDSSVDSTSGEGGTIFDAIDEAPADGSLSDVSLDAPCTSGGKTNCKTSCGTDGDSTCTGGAWGKCLPRPGDPCSGLDCSGKGDGFEHTFYSDGDGDGFGGKTSVQACLAPAGSFLTSTDCDDGDGAVHPGAAESCNGKDDDCNGKIDDGVVRAAAYLAAYGAVPPCNTADKASCKRGAYDFCRAKSACFSGGFGPVELGVSDGTFVCVGPGALVSDWSGVTAAQPACASDSQASLRVCESAVHRAGRAGGHESAILQLHAPFDWSYLPLDADHAKLFASVPMSELTAKHAGCSLATVDDYECNAATHRWCIDKGYVSGFGPVEYSDADTAVVCVK